MMEEKMIYKYKYIYDENDFYDDNGNYGWWWCNKSFNINILLANLDISRNYYSLIIFFFSLFIMSKMIYLFNRKKLMTS
jgi:hypothetical protein